MIRRPRFKRCRRTSQRCSRDGKPYIYPAENSRDVLWRWIKASLCIILLCPFVYVSYTAFFSGQYRWKCPVCDRTSVDPPVTIRTSGNDSVVAETNISHIVFGIGGSARTWHDRRGYSELWWRSGETRGHVWLDEEPVKPWPSTCPPYRVSADASRFGERMSAARIARIVLETYRLGLEGVRWFVMGDDDTVFFTENLVAVLGKYDHEQMYYIGGASESVEQDVMHSYGMAFGGGGFAISFPAAAELARILDGCLDRYSYFYGSDQRVQSCFSELGVPLTRESGFHQVDIRGDPYGLLAAHPIAPLVSLHHLDYVKPIFPSGPTQLDALRRLKGASRVDPARILQQSLCYISDGSLKWSVSVSWGYSVQVYPWVRAPKDMEVALQTFQTWRSYSNGPFTFNTQPFNPDRPCERPLVFFLEQVMVAENGPEGTTTVTDYSRFEPEKDRRCDLTGFATASKVESVRVFAPRMEPHDWRKAPRRQCCETHLTRQGKIIEVRIRKCNPGEAVSPP